MKKLLTLLLIFTLFLTSCTTQPLKDTSSSENHTLYDYAQSQEALDFVKSIAPFVAGYNFSSIDYSACIYPPSEQIRSAINGILYNINSDTNYTDSITSSNYISINSVTFSDFSNNEAVYIVNFNHALSDFNYTSQMKFEVLRKNNEICLKLISNSVFIKDSFSFSLEDKTVALASVILPCSSYHKQESGIITPENYDGNAVWRVMITTAHWSYYEQYPYAHTFEKDCCLDYHFSKQKVRQIAYEIFGIENFDFSPENFAYNHAKDEYISSLEFGGWGILNDIIEVDTDKDSVITVKIRANEKIYSLRFKPITENGETFLRLI